MRLKSIRTILYFRRNIGLNELGGSFFLKVGVALLCGAFSLSSCTFNQEVGVIVTPISSADNLKNAGFYLYIVPQTIVIENKWQADVYMYSFDAHCQPANDAPFNPISITYRDISDDPALSIRVSPSDGILGGTASEGEIQLDSQWVPESKADYYTRESGEVIIRFVDNWGMDVVISSTQVALDNLVGLVAQLEYFGPNPDTVQNPWAEACKQ